MARRWWVVAIALGAVLPVADAAERGRQLYDGYCLSCHGSKGRGDGPDADLFSPRPTDLRGGVLARYRDEELVERIRHGRPLVLSRDPERQEARAADTERLVGHLRQLPRIDWRRAERGQELYVDRCEICHGPFGHPPAVLPPGVQKTPRDLSDPAYQRATSDRELMDRMRGGHQGMPAIAGLDPQENREALVTYVRLLSPGFETYTRFCAGCHGDDGRGPGVEWATAKRPTVVFDATYVANKDPEALRRDVWHMLADEQPQMPHLSRVLRPADVRAILTYLRSPSGD